MTFNRALVVLVLLAGARAHATQPVVCTAAINSTEEIEIFKKRLSPQGFKFVELTDYAHGSTGSDQWYKNACQAKVQCDILLLSGHFAGHFWGRSRLTLTLETMKAARCTDECSGIMERPQEVFLFGCNTLAQKDKDSRTPEQYRQVLMADRLPRATVDHAVATRYSRLSSSYFQGVTQAFTGVPVIYGFNAISPTGAHVKNSVEKFFDEAGPYIDRLNRIRSSNDFAARDRVWTHALSSYSSTQAAGAPFLASNECKLYDKKSSTLSKLNAVGVMLQEPTLAANLLFAGSYLASIKNSSFTSDEATAYRSILADTGAKKMAIDVFDAFKDSRAIQAELLQILSLWQDDPSILKFLISKMSSRDNGLREAAIHALQGSTSTFVVHQLAKIVKRGTDTERDAAVTALDETKLREGIDTLISALGSSSEEVSGQAALSLRNTQDEKALAALIHALESKRVVLSVSAAVSLRETKSAWARAQIFKLAKSSKSQYRISAARALKGSSDAESRKVLNELANDADPNVQRVAVKGLE